MRKSKLFKCLCASLLFCSIGTQSAMAEDLPVTSKYGWRYHPIEGQYKFHAGVDLGYEYGAGVPALFDGEVVAAGDYGDGYGKQVMLYHSSSDTYTKYCHMSSIYVAYGEYVNQGNIIGAVGSSGVSTGPHLHLEYIVRGGNGAYEFCDPLTLWL